MSKVKKYAMKETNAWTTTHFGKMIPRPSKIDATSVEKKKVIDGKRNKKAERYMSQYCAAPGGGEELTSIATKVESYLDYKLPLRPKRRRTKASSTTTKG